MRSGFVTFVGRPNVGKSTLLNAILGTKVTIVSDKPQTTRNQIRGVLNLRSGTQPALRSGTQPDQIEAQVVFVDTPGIHRPRTLLGERLNHTATGAMRDVDVVCLVIDATAPVGPGDRFVGARVPRDSVVVVNKTDIASADQVISQLVAASELDLGARGSELGRLGRAPGRHRDEPSGEEPTGPEYFPVSAITGEGVPALVEHLVERLPDGPAYYPDDMVTDVPEAFRVAELVREQLLVVAREELPHSIATRVTEWEWPRIRCEILVERDSQKGIVIGKGGQVLKAVGTAVRAQLPEGAYLELFVRVDKDWQRRPKSLERLGF